tara:strand:- start:343 stop:1371 length:1029 start_codon:yes stop_codon:yes gene_type:complete
VNLTEKTVLICGGAGFIGSHFVEDAVQSYKRVVVLDLLTYSGFIENLDHVEKSFDFVQGDLSDSKVLNSLFSKYSFDHIVNFAAESHVDRSIHAPNEFLSSNVIGTFELLKFSMEHFSFLEEDRKKDFRYLQISTDEVYGTLGDSGKFNEKSPYRPNSPYSASKAAADHFVRAWYHTYGLPTLITHCTNNYGPRQFPEKLIPLMILNAKDKKKLPVYGTGKNVRDWIHVKDHCYGVSLALKHGVPGHTYCFGGECELQNLDLVYKICDFMDKKISDFSHKSLIEFVEDRKGHDWRYAIDLSKSKSELGYAPRFTFESGLKDTIEWYLSNENWIKKTYLGVKE